MSTREIAIHSILIHNAYHKKTKSQNKIIGENNFTYKIILPLVNKYRKRRKRILDIGCGAGTLSFYLASKGHQITGVDISEKAIKACMKSAKNFGLKNVKFKTVNFPDDKILEKFDFIICSEVIEHLEDDQKALENIYKLLSPKGILLLTTPSINAPLHRLGITKDFDKRVGHLRRYEIMSLKKIIIDNKFRIINSQITEGPIRNFLFINPVAGKFVRFIKFFLVDIVTFIDNVSLKIFGGSDIFIVAKKE